MDKHIKYYDGLNYENLSNKAYDILEELMVTMTMKPGQVYSEKEISTMINIGRTPVREAIKMLELTHMVEIIPRRGIGVTPIRIEECYLQMEVRSMLEKLVAVRAAKFSTIEERNKFKELARRYKDATESGNRLESVRIDNEFNHLVADCSRNVFAKSALMPLHSLARRLYFMQYDLDKELTNKINQSHIDIMISISEGDEEKTLTEMESLIGHIKKLTISAMDSLVINESLYKQIYK